MRVVRGMTVGIVVLFLFSTIIVLAEGSDGGSRTIKVQEDDALMEGHMSSIIGPSFIENAGQWDGSVLYIARTSFGFLHLMRDGVVYEVRGAQQSRAVRIEFEDCGRPSIVATGDLGYPTNYFQGNDPSRWVTGARSYREVVYKSVWPDIDIRYYFSGSALKYDLGLGASSDPNDIMFGVQGPDELRLQGGELEMVMDGGPSIFDSDLFAYTSEDRPVPASFRLFDENSFGFDIERVHGQAVVIDPIVYSTTFMGLGIGTETDFRVDPWNNTVIYGCSIAPLINVTPGAYNTTPGSVDPFVLKINGDGSGIVFATIIGGWHSEISKGMDIDGNGDIYLTGQTYSNDYPTTPGAVDETFYLNSDIYVTKLNSTGSFLEWSTYLGGDGHDQSDVVKVHDDMVLVGGFTMSHDFQTPSGPLGGVHGTAVLIVMDINGTKIIRATQWDGYYGEYIMDIDIDSKDYAVMCGYTGSSDFPVTPHSVQSYCTGIAAAAFVIKYDIANGVTVFSSKFSGRDNAFAYEVEVDRNDDIYFTGTTFDFGGANVLFPTTPGVVDRVHKGVKEGFLTKLTSDGTRMVYSTMLGGSSNDTASSLEVDRAGNVYVTGNTDSPDFPVSPGCDDPTLNGSYDAWVLKINGNATAILNATFLGMDGDEGIGRCMLDRDGNIRVVGDTTSPDYPITDGPFMEGNVSWGGSFLTIMTMKSVPSSVKNLTVVEGDACIRLSWEQPADDGGAPIVGYRIYRGDSFGTLSPHILIGPSEDFTDIEVVCGVEYFYTVAPLNDIGEGPLCDPVSNISSTLPSSPVGLKAVPLRYRISIAFDPPAFTGGVPIMGYSLYKNGSFLTNISIDDMGYVDMDVSAGITYTYAVTSWNRNGESAGCEPVSVRSLVHPSPPRNLTCRSGDGHIDLRWEEPFDNGGTDIDMYMLYRGTSPDDMYAIESIGYDRTSFTDDRLFNGLEYRYFLVAVNEMGWSPPSNTVADRASTVPDPPVSLHLSLGLGYIDLSWSGPEFDGGSPVSQYVVYRGLEGGPLGLYAVLDGGSSNINVTDPVPNVVHSFRVTAVNMVGESAMSDPIEGTSPGLPSEPLALRAEPGLDRITLEWDPPAQRGSPPLYEYDVFRRSTGSERVRIGSVSGAGRSFTDANVTTGDHYWYSVTATNVHGESRSSVEVLSYTIGPPGPPTEVRAFPSEGRVMVIWQPPQNDGGIFLTGYQVFRIGPYGDTVRLFASNASISSCIDYGAEAGMDYGYYVIAMNEIGRSEPSETVRLKVQGPPGAVDYLNATYISGKAFVIWSAPGSDGGSPISEYRIYRTNGSGPESLLGVVPYHIQRIVDGDVAPGCRYVYRVTAVNPIGEGTSTGSVTIDIPIASVEGGRNADYTPYLVSALIFLMVLVPVVLLIRRSKVDTPPAPEDIVEYLDWEEE